MTAKHLANSPMHNIASHLYHFYNIVCIIFHLSILTDSIHIYTIQGRFAQILWLLLNDFEKILNKNINKNI